MSRIPEAKLTGQTAALPAYLAEVLKTSSSEAVGKEKIAAVLESWRQICEIKTGMEIGT